MSLMLFTHYLLGYIGTAIYSIGLVLSLCSIYIFTRRQMRGTVSTYLTGLSVSDSCLLSFGLIVAINSSIPPEKQSESFYSSYIHKYLFPYVYACIIWFQFTSVWIIIGFAIDRWFAIKWPMLHYTYSSKRACYFVLAVYCLGLIYSMPRFFEYKTEVRDANLSESANQTVIIQYLVINNEVLNNTLYQYTVHLALYSVFQSILPLLMLSYFNVELIRSIHASTHFIKHCTTLHIQHNRTVNGETNNKRYRESSVTRSVICLIGLFILCQVPASILHYIYMFYQHHPVLYICYDVSNFLILLNSTVNFFVFAFFNRKFRRELARVCFPSRTSGLAMRRSSPVSLKQTSSIGRSQQDNHRIHEFHAIERHANHWEYSNGGRRRVLRMEATTDDDNGNRLFQKKSSDTSSQSMYDRSESLINLRDHIGHSNHLSSGRYSVFDFDRKKSSFITNKNRQATNFTFVLPYQTNKKQRRNLTPRYLFWKKNSLSSNTSVSSGMSPSKSMQSQHPHYVTYRRESRQKSSSLMDSDYTLPITQSSSITATSNLTRSTFNTDSESSIYSAQTRKIKSPLNNNNKLYRK